MNAGNKFLCNTSVFEHSGKVYAISENYLPHEIDSQTLETFIVWDFNGDWGRPCTSHPKKAPGSGELVIMSIDVKKPFLVVGAVSADGKELLHKVDVQFRKCVLSHEIGVPERYNIIVDHPLSLDVSRLAKGGPLLKYDKEGTTRFGVMPRYGDANSVRCFKVETCCTLHILNTFEDGDEVKERNLSGTHTSMDFPLSNENFTGLKNNFGFTQAVNSAASSRCGLAKYGGLAKLYFDESQEGECEQAVKVEYHKFGESSFCSGSVFVAKNGSAEGEGEDDGWIVTFVQNEVSEETQVHIIDSKDFEGEPVAKIRLPQRVPYGFHGIFMATPHKN